MSPAPKKAPAKKSAASKLKPAKISFTTVLIGMPGMETAGVQCDFDPKQVFGVGRPPVKATINGHTWRTTIANMGKGNFFVVNREAREAAKVKAGDKVKVTIEADTQPREIEVPADLSKALKTNKAAREVFERFSFTHKKEHVRWIEEAKKPETRQRRIEKCLEMLSAGKKAID